MPECGSLLALPRRLHLAISFRHICDNLALRLIALARPLYTEEDLGLNLEETVYARDSSTFDLCLSVFGWGIM